MQKYKDKISNLDSVLSIIINWKNEGERIVFTNGCFDIMHLGHIDYLSKAADLGTKLVIGLNTDSSVNRIKGNDRPIQDQLSRAGIIASLQVVDMVILFDEDTPYNLINAINPDVLVKGSDYKTEDIVGYDIVKENGGSVETIEFLKGYSTTSIIEKIKSL